MKHGLVAFALAAGLGCVSSRLEVGAQHPASPSASTAPLASAGTALVSDFEPQREQHQTEQSRAEPHQHGASSATGGAAEPSPPLWTCPMHPEVRQDMPGNCPICGMKLEPAPPEDSPQDPPQATP